MIADALVYAARGWKVVPLVHGAKTPLTTHGLLEASGSPEIIRAWWAKHPDAGIGIATGAVSGIVVLDVDPAHGGDESLILFQRGCGRLPDTPEVITGGGGRHLYFAHPGHEVRNSAALGGLVGLDLRGDGGYVVAPPSLHPSGQRYEWDSGTIGLPLAAFPSALAGTPLGVPFQRAVVMPDRIPQGQRETVLTSLAGSMRRRGSSPRAIEAALAVENLRCDPPLPATAIHRIAQSIGRYQTIGWSARGGLPE